MTDTTSPDQLAAPTHWLTRWVKVSTPLIVIAAILPIVGVAADKTSGPAVVLIGVLCWLVFLVDLLVQRKLNPAYLRTRSGQVDLAIVIFTCPWYLFVGSAAGAFVTAARMARLVRVVWVAMRGGSARRLMQRIGQAGLYAGGLLVACSLVVKWVEPESSGFETYGDAFWWGFVTLTTVGYGDYYPVSTAGRIAAICLMVGGIALLGVLAGTLASFFGVDRSESPSLDKAAVEQESVPGATDQSASPTLNDEVAALRAEVTRLLARLDESSPPESKPGTA